MTAQRLPLYYTFGNHMHWVDMEWLWGYNVLPDSARDMLRFCAQTGAKGNLNFDGIGYEKMAVEAPEALTELREAVSRGQIEIVGASYGQPYGLFQGGESNVRQRIYGVRAVRRLLGVWPKTFWEEEFDFFPQLPQLLRGVGMEYASLFYQWTWHTPEVPLEETPAIWWEGQDGSRLLAAPRTPLCLHQWPEDFAGLLDSSLLRTMPCPGLIQWLELMPSPDWMCRAELMLPQLQALMTHPEFEIRFGTLSEYLEAAREHAVIRHYRLDDVFHGMSLGKNGDLFRRLSRRAEQSLLAAESLSSMLGLFGRPYAHWDVYPTWELEEAWRELLAAQHHDNDECEGLCGHVGQRSYERSLHLSQDVLERSLRLLADRTAGPPGRMVAYNPLGWARDVAVLSETGERQVVRAVPPFGYRVVDPQASVAEVVSPSVTIERATESVTMQRGDLKVIVNRTSGLVTQLYSAEFPEGLLRLDTPLLDLGMRRNGRLERFPQADVRVFDMPYPRVEITRMGEGGATIGIGLELAPDSEALDVCYAATGLPRPDGGVAAALQTTLGINLPNARLIHDHPYGVSEIRAEGTYRRKYPTGDWMTSPQVFEEIHNPFTALQLVDFDNGERGLLYLHDGSQAMLRDGDCIRNILSMYDPWDEAYFVDRLQARFRLLPHGRLTHAERWKLAQEFNRSAIVSFSQIQTDDGLPPAFGSIWCDTPGVAVTAFYREMEVSGSYLDRYAGQGVGHPYILRVVELNGEAATARLRLPGPVASAVRTNLLGAPQELLTVTMGTVPLNNNESGSQIELSLHPFEIATIYLDLELGRKRPRNLDAYRYVWATIHKVEPKT